MIKAAALVLPSQFSKGVLTLSLLYCPLSAHNLLAVIQSRQSDW